MTDFFHALFKKVWPDDKVPSFQSEMASFFKLCGGLSLRILHMVALGLQLKVVISFHAWSQIYGKGKREI